jgi:catalase
MEVPAALPRAIANPPSPEVTVSPALSLLALPGACGIRTRQVAMLVADGVDGASLAAIQAALAAEGAVGHFVGPRVGRFVTAEGGAIEADKSMENSPSVLFDALVLPDGAQATKSLAEDGHTMEYLKDQLRHCKAILVLGTSQTLLEAAGIRASDAPAGIIRAAADTAAEATSGFITAIAAHRHPSRDRDPPKP